MKETNRERKNDIKFDIQLNTEQKLVKAGVYEKDVTIILGDYGSGKTATAAVCALDLLFKKHVDKIYITRPINFEATGYLKGPQPLYSKILTPYGWVTMRDISVGDDITGKDGLSYKVLSKSETNEELVFRIVTTDGRVMECSRYHLFHTITANDKKHRLDKKKFNKSYQGCVKSLHEIIETFRNSKNKLNHYIPYNEPIEFCNIKEKYIPPYLLGCLLGDGSICDSISFANIDDELITRCIEEGESIGLKCKNVKNTISYYFSSNKENNKPAKEVIIKNIKTGNIETFQTIGQALKVKNINRSTLHSRCRTNYKSKDEEYSFGEKESTYTNPIKQELYKLGILYKKAWEKEIPIEYIYNSTISERLNLLRGLMDTDGTNDGKMAAFTTTSEKLADGIIELVHSLGGRANKYSRNRIGRISAFGGRGGTTRRISYEVVISLDFNPFFITRKAIKYNPNYRHLIGIESIEPLKIETVQCLTTSAPDGLYLTDNYIVTHNSLSEKMALHVFPVKQNFYSAYNKQKIDDLFTEGIIQIIPIDYMKGVTFINACTIVDEFEDITFEEFELVLTRLGVSSKLILTGSEEQISIKESCIHRIKCLKNYPEVNYHTLTGQHRNEDIGKILKYIKENS